MINLYHEAREIAQEAMKDFQGQDSVLASYVYHDRLCELCDSHRASFVYHEGIKFCVDVDTSRGEEFLEECGGIARDGDTFGEIACRIAYHTLYLAALDALEEILKEQAA